MSKFFALGFLVLFFSACSEYSRVVKKGTNEEKYDMALKLYKNKDYVRALPLLEDLLVVYRGKEISEEVYFYYCYSYYGLGQYELAAFHFKNFTENYYNSKHMEECAFRYTDCLYLSALPYFLDQTNTYKAIAEIQVFLNKYPNSAFKEEGNKSIETLRKTLMDKAYENAMLFYRLGDYLGAIVSFKNAIKDFPDIGNKDEIELHIVKASYYYAKYSIDEKKSERYNAVFEEYAEFIRHNKEGNKYYNEAKLLNDKAREELNKHLKLQNIQ